MMPAPRTSGSKSAFTLVELLVTIAIVSALAVLAFVSMQRLQIRADDVRCVRNLQVVGAGALVFIADHDGYLLPSKFWYNASSALKPGFRDYVGVTNPSLSAAAPSGLWIDTPFTCPAIKRLDPKRYPSYLNRGFAANIYAHRNDPEIMDDKPADQQVQNPTFPMKLVNIETPSQVIMFLDGLRILSPANSLPTYLKPSLAASFALPHSGQQNVVFFDGSVRKLDADDFAETATRKIRWGYR